MKKNIIVFIFVFIFMYYYYYLSEPFYEQYYLDNKHRTIPKIYDIGHKYLPNIEKYQYLINVVIGISILKLVFASFIFDFLLLLLFLHIVRLITIQLTVLPKMKSCVITNNITLDGYCYDKIFSGHVTFMFLFTLFLYKYKEISMIFLFIINVLYSILIISTRAHYTIDVIVSFLFTFIVFQNRSFFLKFFYTFGHLKRQFFH